MPDNPISSRPVSSTRRLLGLLGTPGWAVLHVLEG